MKSLKFIRTMVAVGLVSLAGLCHATETVKILVGYPPGGGVDALARIFAGPLSAALGKTVVVENRPGASGQLAAQALKAAPADGSTLLLSPDAVIVVAPHTYAKLPYDPLHDFVAVAHTGTFEYGLVVAADNPARTLKDWVASAKADPKKRAYGTTGLGTGPHFVGMMLAQDIGVPLEAVSYKGVAPATNDAISGHIPAVVLPFGQLDPFVKSGKLRVLAHSGDRRSPFAPEVPTFTELGYPSAEIVGWYGLFAPADTNPDVVQRYNAVIREALKAPETRQRVAALGLGIKDMGAAAMASMVRADHARWRSIVKSTGYSADAK